ncbi:Monooxygenase FAD-binding protein [Neofusicoccum parvum]|uniref:Monooxygenase FAD-binding protein n=1 Tax=Neofusicoccum parvum TaxID=310453 RepID=A0ACB5SNH2_9PEZI|nr:Monooxygenase FAD-binding protein [Neofusicoccum parvum]
MPTDTPTTPDPWLHGSRLPYAEPAWSRGSPSPYLTATHRRLRAAMRAWVETAIMPFAHDWEEAGAVPPAAYVAAADAGILMPMAAGSRVPEEWRGGRWKVVGDVPAEEWDGFCDFVVHDEMMRVGGIGVITEVLSGQKRICLAITEPNAGSDVQGIATEAQLTPDGKHFVVDGQKKWITSGMYADYFLTLVKDQQGGQTLLVIPRTEGVSTRHMKMSGSSSAGTAFVEFNEVKVPVENVVGERGKAFKYIVSNFNHERLFIAFQSVRSARVCLEDSMSYALSRETFGKKLVDHPVIRFKFAHMSRETEALQSWIESLIYQLGALSAEDGSLYLAGPTAQLKAHSGIVLEHVVREAIQIMGGVGLTRGGRGERVERIWRDVKAITVPGGSEEILLDLAVRRALKLSMGIKVIIVGAGMGGLGTAIAVQEAGHEPIVLEQAPGFVEVGAGVQVPPNAARELIRWGLKAEMEAIASKPNQINYRSWKTGKPQGFTDMSQMPRKYGAPYWQVYRPDYHTVLFSAALKRGIEVRKGCLVTEYRPEDSSVVLESGEVVKGDLIVAADGVKSLARQVLAKSVEPHETGDTCFRVVVPREKLLADSELAPLVHTPGFEQFLGPDHHIIGYNMQREKFFNLLMVIPDDRTMKGYKAPANAEEVRKAYTGWSQMVQKLLSFLPDDVEKWRLIDLKPFRDWVHPSGKMVVIGDASHATLPYLAQGAAMAIEDAAALGVALSHLNSASDLPRILQFFYESRVERVHTIQRGSWTNRFFIHMNEGPMLDMREEIFGAGDYPGSPNLMGNTLFQQWLYGHDATKATKARWDSLQHSSKL